MDQKMRFRELSRELNILPHILSKELRQLEVNQLVKRTVCDTRPVTVEYELTTYSRMLGEVVRAMHIWGNLHHETIVCGTRPVAAVAGRRANRLPLLVAILLRAAARPFARAGPTV